MNIKQSIFALLVFIGVSFSAHSAEEYNLPNVIPPRVVQNFDLTAELGCFQMTDYWPTHSFRYQSLWQNYTELGYIWFIGNRYNSSDCSGSPENGSWYMTVKRVYCGAGENPDGTCKNSCQVFADDGRVINRTWEPYIYGMDVTGSRYGSAETLYCELRRINSTVCTVGDFGITPADSCTSDFVFTGALSTSDSEFFGGTPPGTCSPGVATYPACLGAIDPTNPIDTPSQDFDRDTATPSDPSAPSFSKPEPDEVTPTETTDTAVLEAITNLNRDSNLGFEALSTDLNDGFTQVNDTLADLVLSNDAIGQTAVDQLNQDYQIYLNTKDLILHQTNTIAEGADAVVSGLHGQTSALSNQLASSTNTMTDNLENLGDRIVDKLDAVSLTDGVCNPNEDPLNCEGVNGLDSDLATRIHNELNDSVAAQFDAIESDMLYNADEYTNDYYFNDALQPVKNVVRRLEFVYPYSIKDCTSFTMPSPFGDVDFGCEFSYQFKTVASFLLYVYTLWSLVDILLNGVTPVPGTVPHRSRGI